MKLLPDYSFKELKEIVLNYKEPSFRALQLYKWIILGKDYSEMNNIPKSFTEKLSEEFNPLALEILEKITASDGTIKYLYRLNDGNIIEGVLMNYKHGNTLCVSTQVGCRMGCAFCASGIGGLVRNLSSGEILGQVIAANRDMGGNSGERKITNIVLMGSGEPLDNYDNTVKFIKNLSSKEGLGISQRNVSLSTCGLVDKIKMLEKEGLGINLTISLHAPYDEIRKKIMPIANRYCINELIEECKNYFDITKRRVIFEYAVIDGINDSYDCAHKLKELFKGFSYHLNLIRLNYVKEKNLKPSKKENFKKFTDELEKLKVSFTVRRTMGDDVGGACGQLRRSYMEKHD